MENLEPSKEDRKKFDIDLEYGKVREQFRSRYVTKQKDRSKE